MDVQIRPKVRSSNFSPRLTATVVSIPPIGKCPIDWKISSICRGRRWIVVKIVAPDLQFEHDRVSAATSFFPLPLQDHLFFTFRSRSPCYFFSILCTSVSINYLRLSSIIFSSAFSTSPFLTASHSFAWMWNFTFLPTVDISFHISWKKLREWDFTLSTDSSWTKWYIM